MIPFNHLGWFFNAFGASAYPAGIVEELCEALQELPLNAALLDIGAGTGVMSRYARRCRDDLECTAADPAEGMLRYVPGGIRTVSARAEALPFEERRFDAVLMGEALHHFDDPTAALGEIARVLTTGGLLFVYEFDPATLLGRFLRFAETLLGEPGHFYTPAALQAMLEPHGFSVRVSRHGWRYSLVARLPERP